MGDIANLESVAKLRPVDQRERFYLTIQKYRKVPDDDDHLIMLDAMGFIALFMKELPNEIRTLLDHASQRLSEDQATTLGEEFKQILTNSLDTPSYKDLRDTVREMGNHTEKFQRNSDAFLRHFSEAERSMTKRNRLWPNLANGLIGAVVTMIAAYFLLPHLQKPRPLRIPTDLKPLISMYRTGELRSLDVDLPEYGGNVRILTVEGKVLTAFKDGFSGVVVLKSPESQER